MFDIHTWAAGTLSDFARPFKENEVLYNQARAFWHTLEGCSLGLTIVSVLIAFGLAWLYYIPFNNQPGRHYKPSYWGRFFVATFLVTFVFSIFLEIIMAGHRLDGAIRAELMIAGINSLYALLFYLLASFLFCKCSKTNAYPIF